MKRRVCDAAVEVLRETDNPRVTWGDERLLHMIADRLGWEHDCGRTSARVLAALSKTPGPLVRLQVKCGRHWVRSFQLPEEKPCTEESS